MTSLVSFWKRSKSPPWRSLLCFGTSEGSSQGGEGEEAMLGGGRLAYLLRKCKKVDAAFCQRYEGKGFKRDCEVGFLKQGSTAKRQLNPRCLEFCACVHSKDFTPRKLRVALQA